MHVVLLTQEPCVVVLSWMAAETDPEEKNLLNKIVIFVYFIYLNRFIFCVPKMNKGLFIFG